MYYLDKRDKNGLLLSYSAFDLAWGGLEAWPALVLRLKIVKLKTSNVAITVFCPIIQSALQDYC